jgi:hypothetical protein
MKKQLSSWNILNDTDRWAAILDNRFQLVDSQAECEAIRAEIFSRSGGSEHIQDTAFEFCEFLAPQTGRADGERLSECEPCDLMAYMAERRAELDAIPDPVYDFSALADVLDIPNP